MVITREIFLMLFPVRNRVTSILESLKAEPAFHKIDLPVSLVDGATEIITVAQGLAMTEGPLGDPGGSLYFTEPFENKIWKMDSDGTVYEYRFNSNLSNGLVFDINGNLLAGETGRISRTLSGSTFVTVVSIPAEL